MPKPVLIIAFSVTLLSCKRETNSGKSGLFGVQEGSAACSTIDLLRGVGGEYSDAQTRTKTSPPVSFDTIFDRTSADLDCDGVPDLVIYGLEKTSGVAANNRPSLFAFLKKNNEWRVVLRSKSPVDGNERVAILSALTDKSHRDIITVGEDEGGTVIRIFRWTSNGYVPIAVPDRYELRQEEQRSVECANDLYPRVVDQH